MARAPRIHGELNMLGIAISERTVLVDSFTPTISDLEDVSAQSPRSHRVSRLLYCSNHPPASLVRVLGAGASPAGSAPLTAPQSPWQNAQAERLIGSVRRECLNHRIILNARHPKRILAAYFTYHRSRRHSALEKECPIEPQIKHHGVIVEIAELGGLYHR